MGAPTNPFGLATAAYQALVAVLAQTTAAFTSAEKTKLANVATGIDVEAVQAPTLAGSWANLGSGFPPAGYYRDRGRVYIQGSVTGGTGTIFTLPVGYRPTAGTMTFPVSSNGVFGLVSVGSDGVVSHTVGSPYVHLAGISFII